MGALNDAIAVYKNQCVLLQKEVFEQKQRESDQSEQHKIEISKEWNIDLHETELNALRIELQAKDAKIEELTREILSWQETHSDINDSFTSATKLYSQQIERFNDEISFY